MMRQIEFGVKLYLLSHVAVTSSALRLIMLQGTKVLQHRYLDYTNIVIYKIHIASRAIILIYLFSSLAPFLLFEQISCSS